MDDPLWTHFKPLWLHFQKAGNGVLVAGGYGLFLKQTYLLDAKSHSIVIPFEQWQDVTPRATGDMDLIVALDLISDEASNKKLFEALKQEGFEVSEEPHGKRWKFFKKIGNDQQVIVELHAPKPEEKTQNIRANRFTVKHIPSLGEEGIHGRTNQEAVGSELHPFRFELEGVKIFVPNPVTWSVMKLTAAEDNWSRSQDEERETKDRKFFRDQAIKHGQDVCRAVAMTTIEERDASNEVADAIKGYPQFERASGIYHQFFAGADNWANEVLADKWIADDLEVIHNVLGSWYNK